MGFDAPVAPGGYAWWYVDGLSRDGQQGLTLIAFVGSVFSPYYAWARRRGRGDPTNHCALNVALYGAGRGRWAMTERGRGDVQRAPEALVIGPSSLEWDGSVLTIHIDELTAPWPSRIRGTVQVRPEAVARRVYDLDREGQHRWRPAGPVSVIEVDLEEPALHWSGEAYFDINTGDAPLEDAFSHWDWSRASGPDGTSILYDVVRRGGEQLSIALDVDRGGMVRPLAPPPRASLPTTLWRMRRGTRADPGFHPQVLRTFEDAPFYARSLVASQMQGASTMAIHETLSLDRFREPWVQSLLPFRMPRWAR